MFGVAAGCVENDFPSEILQMVGDLVESAQSIKLKVEFLSGSWTHLAKVPATTTLLMALKFRTFAHVVSTFSTQCCMIKDVWVHLFFLDFCYKHHLFLILEICFDQSYFQLRPRVVYSAFVEKNLKFLESYF